MAVLVPRRLFRWIVMSAWAGEWVVALFLDACFTDW